MRKLLLTVDHQFVRTPDGKIWVKTIYGYNFWERYLEVFDEVRVVARVRDENNINEKMLLSSGENVEFYSLPQYRGPKEFLAKYHDIKRKAADVAHGCDCAILRIPSPIANMVKDEIVKQKIPWAVEIVNDPWDNFSPRSFTSLFRPIYRMHFTWQVHSFALHANGVSYVTKYALQERYPSYARIHGEDKEHFESYYSSINLRKDYFWEKREFPKEKSRYTIVHVNSCITDFSKGHDVVIRIVKTLNNKGLPVRALFIGDGPKREYFEKYATKEGVGEYISFTGLLSSSDEVREQLINSDILVFPTVGEGLPRTVIEAMAVGLPCLSTPVNGIPELLSNEFLFDQQNVEGFADKIEELLNNQEKYESVSQCNIKKAMEYENQILQMRRNSFYRRLNELKSEYKK